MATSKSYNSAAFKDTCTCTLFAANFFMLLAYSQCLLSQYGTGFSGLGNRMVSFKFTPDWPLLPR